MADSRRNCARAAAERNSSATPTHAPYHLPEDRRSAPYEVRIAAPEPPPQRAHGAHQRNDDQEENERVRLGHGATPSNACRLSPPSRAAWVIRWATVGGDSWQPGLAWDLRALGCEPVSAWIDNAFQWSPNPPGDPRAPGAGVRAYWRRPRRKKAWSVPLPGTSTRPRGSNENLSCSRS